LNYSLFKDTALRKKLQELGISAQGNRQLLERRHAEWVILWNANCDASRPRKKIELLHDLDIWERTQGSRAPSASSGVNTASQILHKDFDGAGWAAKHDLSFQNLIANARKNLSKAGPKRQPAETDPVADGENFEGASAASLVTPLDGITRATITNDQDPSPVQQVSSHERTILSEHHQNNQ
jgi:E3 ubiquitin-protein ligase RAD18